MTPETPVQPRLDDLLARYLKRQTEAHQAGLVDFNPGKVTPYEAGPVQPIDPKLAWDAATAALGAAQGTAKLLPPPGWPQLVVGHEPAVALAFCVGNFPQLVRNFHLILQRADLTTLQPQAGRPNPVQGLEDWANQTAARAKYPQVLLALAALRLAKMFEQADRFVAAHESAVPDAWRAAWDNEKAALAWHRGQMEQAHDLWQTLEPSVPVLFNRGMADLFLGRPASAHASLANAVQGLPESSAWHHLGQLYLTLARPEV